LLFYPTITIDLYLLVTFIPEQLSLILIHNSIVSSSSRKAIPRCEPPISSSTQHVTRRPPKARRQKWQCLRYRYQSRNNENWVFNIWSFSIERRYFPVSTSPSQMVVSIGLTLFAQPNLPKFV